MHPFSSRRCGRVDIGTEWNLEIESEGKSEDDNSVDIGTEWNLEIFMLDNIQQMWNVDIGTEWNLESVDTPALTTSFVRRYRNRVEFRVERAVGWIRDQIGRYRNRVEFRDDFHHNEKQ